MAFRVFLELSLNATQCYKPWELLSGEDARIKSQIEEAEATIQRETSQLDSEKVQDNIESQATGEAPVGEPKIDIEQRTDVTEETVGSETNSPNELNGNIKGETTDKDANHLRPEPEQVPTDQQENPKDNDDDGGEMVEADEDMVIY